MKIYNLDQMKGKKLWYDIRPGIFYGYRAHMDYISSLKSFLMVHNETVNIWSHLLCFLFWAYELTIMMNKSHSLSPLLED